MRRLLALLFVFFIPLVVRAEETPPHLLAFALVEAPGTFTPDYTLWQPYGYRETIYVYNLESDSLQKIGVGNAVRWSPSGRYLALVDIYNQHSYLGNIAGKINRFSIYDFETGDMQTHSYDNGDYLLWSPFETTLMVGGSQSHGLNGSNAWVDFFDSNGSGTAPEPHLTFVGGILGSHGGVFPIGWVGIDDGGALLARDQGVGQTVNVLIDPVTHEETPIEGDLPPYIDFIKTGFGDIGASKSPDNHYTAVTRVSYAWDVDKDFSTYLLIVDMDTGKTHEVTLPVSTGAVVAQMAWRSCRRTLERPQCYF